VASDKLNLGTAAGDGLLHAAYANKGVVAR
jgi:hypothetical protein